MSRSEQKIVRYLNEAHASEVGLVRVLRSQIAMTPRGGYRTGLERHLRETEAHAVRVQARLGELAPTGADPGPRLVAPQRADAASARTRTAPASCSPSSASSPTPKRPGPERRPTGTPLNPASPRRRESPG